MYSFKGWNSINKPINYVSSDATIDKNIYNLL